MDIRRQDNGREKKKPHKRSMPPEPEKNKEQKQSYYRKNKILRPKPIRLTLPDNSLRKYYKEMVESKKIVKVEEYTPISLHIEKTNYGLGPNYVVFLKCTPFLKSREYSFDLRTFEENIDENGRSGFVLREEDLKWGDDITKSPKKREFRKFYYNIPERAGKKEIYKIKRRELKQAKILLFETVISVAKSILNYSCDWRDIPLIYQEFPKGTRRVHDSAKEALDIIERNLERRLKVA